jgi:hypothetical protein
MDAKLDNFGSVYVVQLEMPLVTKLLLLYVLSGSARDALVSYRLSFKVGVSRMAPAFWILGR